MDGFTRVLQLLFNRQGRDIAHQLIAAEALDRDRIPDLTHWVRAMADIVKPYLLQYWRQGMTGQQRTLKSNSKGVMWNGDKRMRVPEGLLRGTSFDLSKSYVVKAGVKRNSPGRSSSTLYDYSLFQSRVSDAVDEHAFKFARSTLETATTDLDTALKKLRKALKNGRLDRKNAVGELAEVVEGIFADPDRAKRIAFTERVRALRGGQFLQAKNAGVKYKTWRAHPGCCSKCADLDGKTVRLNKPFVVLRGGSPYAVIMYPPYHPWCGCGITTPLQDYENY